jgi:DNA polymerase IV
MFRERSILHFNVADFAVAVERIIDTSLKSRAVIIAPLQAARSAVYDMSEEAYQAGVRKGMLLRQAARMCRGAEILQPRVDVYRKAMKGLLRQAQEYSPLVEHGMEDGHLFVDVTGTHRLFGPPVDVGLQVRRAVRQRLGLNPIWALAANKLVSKVASRLVKPVGEYIVTPGEEQQFLAPLPVSLLPGLDDREIRQLRDFRIATIGQLAGLSRSQLMVPFGSRSTYLHDISHGIDNSAILGEVQDSAPVDCEHIFADDTNDQREVEAAVADLVSRAGAELRRRRQEARRVGVWISYADGAHVVRQATARRRTASDFLLLQLAGTALARAWQRRGRLRSCRLVCDDLHRQSPQLALFPETQAGEVRQDRLLTAMDSIRDRFGHGLIATGRQYPAMGRGNTAETAGLHP